MAMADLFPSHGLGIPAAGWVRASPRSTRDGDRLTVLTIGA